jgi:hypothetical protein
VPALVTTTNATNSKCAKNSGDPNIKDILVPSNAKEQNSMTNRLIKVHTLPAEAEQIFAMRKSTYNKASREMKKVSNKFEPKKDLAKAPKRSPKNSPKTQKNIAPLTDDHAN